MKRGLAVAALIAVAIVGVLMMRGGDDPYTVDLKLANAGGLKSGTPVVIGGVPIGKVELSADFKTVTAKLKIDDQYAPIGRDATASIISQNLLGQKQVSIAPGDVKGDPAPDGFDIPESAVSKATDLDQLLSTFDSDTRARLAILLDEAGTAFAGREMDYKTFVSDFAPTLSTGTELLAQFTQDNRALVNLLDASDGYVAELADNRKQVGDLLNKFGQTFETVAAKRNELRETIAKAPAGLTEANRFLAEFDRISTPLGNAAARVADTTPSLVRALDNVDTFVASTKPILADFPTLGKSLEFLSDNGTVILERLKPPVAELRNKVSNTLPAVTDTVDGSIDNTIATTVNWASAIQQQDGLGRIFRGEAAVSPEYYRSIIAALTGGAGLADTKPGTGGTPARKAPRQTAPAPEPNAPQSATPNQPLNKPLGDVNNLLGQVLGNTGQTVQQLQETLGNLGIKPGGKLDLSQLGKNAGPGSDSAPNSASPLLDLLLGK